MSIRIKLGISVLLSFMLIAAVYASTDPAPLAMLRQTSNQMINALKKNRTHLKNGDQIVNKIVHDILLPHISLEVMSRSVVGRPWLSASASARKSFQREFTKYVTRTYSSALSAYEDETVAFQPIRGGLSPNQSRIQIYSRITRSSGPVISVNYRLIRSGKTWKVYDFSVDGVSMVRSYRSQFADILQRQGFSALIERLKKRNREEN